MWSEELKKLITMSDEVRQYLDLDDKDAAVMDEILKTYPMAITPYYLSLVDFSDPNDPIRKMCIPTVGEWILAELWIPVAKPTIL